MKKNFNDTLLVQKYLVETLPSAEPPEPPPQKEPNVKITYTPGEKLAKDARIVLNGIEYRLVPVEKYPRVGPPEKEILKNCHDCGAKPGQVHDNCCDVEMCSVCGGQKLQCNCMGHNKAFARWSGFWPGILEAKELGIDLNEFYSKGYNKIFFILPNEYGPKMFSKIRKNKGRKEK